MPPRPSRRDVLKAAAALGVGVPGAELLRSLPGAAAGASSLTDIQHVVIFMQENRGFDHYFGSYKGVRGFDDRSQPGGASVFAQRYRPQPTPTGYPDPMLPFHIDTTLTLPPQQGMCTNDIEHQWPDQHDAWNRGAGDNWMNAHIAVEGSNGQDARQAALTMGYYTRSDLDFYYALADNFTICDNYFCSVLGGTDVNRLHHMTGTLDADGWDGGCQFLDTQTGVYESPGFDLGTAGRWKPYPQLLSQAGISWKCYGTADGLTGDNVLRYFPQFRPGVGDLSLSRSAFLNTAFPVDFIADCLTGQLPQVSWLFASLVDSEHPPGPLVWGESIVHTVLSAMVASGIWSTSVLLLSWDENGGFFDHVLPPTAPAGTPGEYLNQAAITPTCRAQATTADKVDHSHEPVGLGWRVPAMAISPFSRNPNPAGGPMVCSDLLDHTSQLRFVETWLAAKGTPVPVADRSSATRTPGLSAWRRALVGDMTAAFNFAATPDSSMPPFLLSNIPNRADPRALAECTGSRATFTLGAPTTAPLIQDPVIPATASMPHQEPLPGPVLRPSGLPRPAATAPGSVPRAPVTAALPNTARAGGGVPATVELAAAAGVVAAGWWARRVRANSPVTTPPAQPPA